MTRPSKRRAAVLAAALNSWATSTATTGDPHVARLVVRQPPDWEHAGINNLTDHQVARLIGLLREDLIPTEPPTPVQVAATLDQLLAEWRAEGKTTIRAADLTAALPRLGCTTAELATQLVRLVDARYLRETRRPGTYRLSRPGRSPR